MATKLILVLSILVAAAAGYFGWQTNQTMEKVRADTKVEDKAYRDATAEDTVKQTLLTDEAKLAESLLQDVANEKANQKGYDQKMTQLDNNLEQIEQEMAELKPEKIKLETLLANLPAGMNIETVTARVDELKKTQIELEDNILTLQAENDTFVAQQADIAKSMEAVQGRRAEKVKRIAKSAFVAGVSSVDHDWGFAIVNAGENQGITAASKLIVLRGTQRIGLLTITKIEPTRLVADIVPKSQTPGMRIMAGDQVILAKAL